MVETFGFPDLARWLLSLARRLLPDRVLRWAWSEKDVLSRIEAFHFTQAPGFYVRTDRDNHELFLLGFNVFNFSPFRLAIVGVDVRVSLDSRELFRYDHRFSSDIPMPPAARSGFAFQHSLSGPQVDRLRQYPKDYANIRIDGAMILRTPYGERRKEVVADLAAIIDR